MMTSRQSSSARESCHRRSIETGLAILRRWAGFRIERYCVSDPSIVAIQVGMGQVRVLPPEGRSRLSPRRFSARYSRYVSLVSIITAFPMASIGDGGSGTLPPRRTEFLLSQFCLADRIVPQFPPLLVPAVAFLQLEG